MMNSEKYARIRTLLLDVDGVLTQGDVIYDDNQVEIKHFNVRDGLGIRLLTEAGLHVGVVTGRKSAALDHRCRDLGIKLVYDNIRDKVTVLDQILAETKSAVDETAFIGDDLPDLPLLQKVGVSFAVADAHEVLRKHVDWVTCAKGGCGAVREVCEIILKAKGLWEGILESYLNGRQES